MSDENYLKEVRSQYETFPYPVRDPQDETQRLLSVYIGFLDRINHYCFSGKRNFYEDFRFLDAGGGTGDMTIFMAEQLRGTGQEVTYLDFSEASMSIAQERARIRGLDNINWVHGSILDAPELNLGEFDFIHSSGVLHHLESPEDGLAKLNVVLKDDGAMSIMLYGKHARTAVYQMQELMRIINMDEDDMHNKVVNCRKIVHDMPENSMLARNLSIFEDYKEYDKDTGIYDLFLHARDRAYSVTDVYDYIEPQGLHVVELFQDDNPVKYLPELYIRDSDLLSRVRQLSRKDQQQVAEILSGTMKQHTLYASRNPSNTIADIENEDNIPAYSIFFLKDSTHGELYQLVSQGQPGDTVHLSFENRRISFIKTMHTEMIFRYLDGVNTIGQIVEKCVSDGAEKEQLINELKSLFHLLNINGWMFLIHRSVPAIKSLHELNRVEG